MAVISASHLHAIRAQVSAEALSVSWRSRTPCFCLAKSSLEQVQGLTKHQETSEERKALHNISRQKAAAWPDALQVACSSLHGTAHCPSRCLLEMKKGLIDHEGWFCKARMERKRRERMEKLAKDEAISAEVGL